MESQDQDWIVELDRVGKAIDAHLAMSASVSITEAVATDALRRRLLYFRKEVKRLDRVSLHTLEQVRHQLRSMPDSDWGVPQIAMPDLPGYTIERDRAFQRLRDFSRRGRELIITDPYFFAGEASGCTTYVDEIIWAIRLKSRSLKKLVVVYDARCGETKPISSAIKKACSDFGVTYKKTATTLIHDRFWIKDRSAGIVVGTSLGGIGRKLCLINPIPDDDVRELLKVFNDFKLL
jgi:hypothetical protein